RGRGATVELVEEDRRLRVRPPRTGWEHGETYVVLVRSGEAGLRDLGGREILPDIAFYYLRIAERLDTYENNRAFPGATREERLEVARRLEEIREELEPYFAFFETTLAPISERIPRDEIAALWSFTVTSRPELAMDRPSQRVPLPFDPLFDPDTGRVEIPHAPWDTSLERDAKDQLIELDGFGVSSNSIFELTEAVDPSSVSRDTVSLWSLEGSAPRRIEVALRVMAPAGEAPCRASPVDPGCRHLIVEPAASALPLSPGATYVLLVHQGLRGASGAGVVAMPMGSLLLGQHPVWIDGESQVGAIDDASAHRLEHARLRLAPFLDARGRSDLIAAWSFTTLTVDAELSAATRRAEVLGYPSAPTGLRRMTPLEALEMLSPGFAAVGVRAAYLPRTFGVREFVEGELEMPDLLDPLSRRLRDDSGHEPVRVRFLAAVPEGLSPSVPVPVVIFGHPVVSDRRFLATIAGSLALRGFASVAIDFPFHGERTICLDSSLVGVPNFLPPIARDLTGLQDPLLTFPPCASGSSASCTPDGRCLDASGRPDAFTSLPLVALQPAAGAAFLDVGDIPYIKDHFLQALSDLGALERSLREADWQPVFGAPVQRDRFFYLGQSLGAIVGTVWVSQTPSIERAVFNVPGSDLVDLFIDSTYFGPQIDVHLSELGVSPGSFEEERLLNVARWIVDSVDPHTVAPRLASEGRVAMIQLSTGDIIIPNATTWNLARVSGLPLRSYPSALHADLVIPLLGDAMLEDASAFLAGEIDR
ncbi:MAG: hypothetical protein OEY14_06330, partial [Myxococcales bacterium]|nr:hypothetical protein [Myxococcales bacterium]